MKTDNNLINLSFLSFSLMGSSVTTPTYANTPASVDEVYKGQVTLETVRLPVEKMHQEVYTRVKSMQADKTDELISEVVSQ